MGERLHREVEVPLRHDIGLGLMLAASACLFFAVAGSAFLVRARETSVCGQPYRVTPYRSVEAVTPYISVPAYAPRAYISDR
jgi:hypothetical protein